MPKANRDSIICSQLYYYRDDNVNDKWLYSSDTMHYIKILKNLDFDIRIGVYHHTIRVIPTSREIIFKYLGIKSDINILKSSLDFVGEPEMIAVLDVSVAKSLLLGEI